MNTEIQIAAVGTDALVAHVNKVILATASLSGGIWLLSLRSGDGYLPPDRAATVAALRAITGPIPAGIETICEDTTCCLACEHGGEHHSAEECWIAGDNVTGPDQCPCDWYQPALIAHRHLAPAQIGATA